jgi:hypothetical protein
MPVLSYSFPASTIIYSLLTKKRLNENTIYEWQVEPVAIPPVARLYPVYIVA